MRSIESHCQSRWVIIYLQFISPESKIINRLETTKKELIREYQELVNDETPVVKQRAIASLLQIMDFIDLGMSNFALSLGKIVMLPI